MENIDIFIESAEKFYDQAMADVLADFYAGNFEKLEKARSGFYIHGMIHTRLIWGWQIGLENGVI